MTYKNIFNKKLLQNLPLFASHNLESCFFFFVTAMFSSSIRAYPYWMVRSSRSRRSLWRQLATGKDYDILNSTERVNRLGTNGEDGFGLRTTVNGYGDHSFTINNVYVPQPVLLLPNSFLLWENVSTMDDITPSSLRLFTKFHPSLEILIVGLGENPRLPSNSMQIRKYFRDNGIVVEMLGTVSAASTFNVLNSEGRNVAAALLTLKHKK